MLNSVVDRGEETRCKGTTSRRNGEYGREDEGNKSVNHAPLNARQYVVSVPVVFACESQDKALSL